MEEKINIAEILENKSQGTKLYSLTYGDCFYQEYTGDFGIECKSQNGVQFILDEYGKYCIDGECILFPSKEMRNWGKFAWKKGDVLVNKDGDVHIIFERFVDDTYCSFVGKYYLWKENNDTEHFYKNERLLISDFQKAGKDAAQTYINTIEERLCGKLNHETLEIENAQPEFKDGDIVVTDAVPSLLYSKCIFILKGDLNTGESRANSYVFFNINNNYISYDVLDTIEKERNIHFASDSEKQQLFDAIKKDGKAWDSDKKAIVDLKPKCEFKPFDKVLCRNSKDDTWEADFFARLTRKEIDYTQSGKYLCLGGLWMYCIPYNEETSHLLGTTDEWKGGEG